jgi:hypothetical protein
MLYILVAGLQRRSLLLGRRPSQHRSKPNQRGSLEPGLAMNETMAHEAACRSRCRPDQRCAAAMPWMCRSLSCPALGRSAAALEQEEDDDLMPPLTADTSAADSDGWNAGQDGEVTGAASSQEVRADDWMHAAQCTWWKGWYEAACACACACAHGALCTLQHGACLGLRCRAILHAGGPRVCDNGDWVAAEHAGFP